MNKIFSIFFVSLLIVCGCSSLKDSKVYSTYYEGGVVYIQPNDILLNIYENKKYVQYKLIFDEKELIKKFVKEVSKEEYYDSYNKWKQQLTKNILYSERPYPREYIKILTKKIDDIVITQFDKVEIRLIRNEEHYTLISKIEIKLKNKLKNIFLNNSNIFDLTIIKVKNKNYLIILYGSEGSSAFVSMVDVYKL